jgi:hypothetical protein
MRNNPNQLAKLRNTKRKIDEIYEYMVKYGVDAHNELYWVRFYLDKAIKYMEEGLSDASRTSSCEEKAH